MFGESPALVVRDKTARYNTDIQDNGSFRSTAHVFLTLAEGSALVCKLRHESLKMLWSKK